MTIYLNNVRPRPKNPKIAKIFHEIGWADELGSGVRNLVKYTKIYFGGVLFLMKKIFLQQLFLLIIREMKVDRKRTVTDSNEQKNFDELNIACKEILKLIKENKNITQKEITNKLGYGRTKVTGNMKVLVEKGYIKRECSKKAGYWEILKQFIVIWRTLLEKLIFFHNIFLSRVIYL